MKLLLLSNSSIHGEGYLDWAESEIRPFFSGVQRVVFVPWALDDVDGYARTARERFEKMGIALTSIHEASEPRAAAAEAEGFFVGGGNSFRLLTRLYVTGTLEAIGRRVREGGARYMGSSAGTNMACPSIKTTNDMPIVYPPSFDALGLIPFQINPHYLDPDPGSTHMGETREKRILEFHEMNDAPVLGLREGALIRVDGSEATLWGRKGARLFRKGEEPKELEPGDVIPSVARDQGGWGIR
ncbi:MAG: dipeptidase PepE [Thermoanaerobaculia bacterium]